MRNPCKTLITSALCLLSGLGAHGAIVAFALDFQNTSGTSATATGWTAVSAGVPNLNTFVNPVVVLNPQYTLSFTGTLGTYSTGGTATNPLNQDGWFVPGGGPGFVTYTISGLTFGDKVTVRAIDAWDGSGRAAYVSFGGLPNVDTALAANSPGLSPVASDLVYIGERLSLGETSFSGTISIKTAEAQFGGFYIEIDQYAIPEPSMLGLLLLGFGLVATTRRRQRAA